MVSSDSDLLLSFLGFLLLHLGGGGGLLCEGDLQVGGRETETQLVSRRRRYIKASRDEKKEDLTFSTFSRAGAAALSSFS